MQNMKIPAVAASLFIALAILLIPLPLEENAHRMLSIALFMAAMWVSEAMPLHVTALLGSVLMIIFVPLEAKTVFAPYFSPAVVLLLGGFFYARAMQKHGLDRHLATWLISHFGTDPKWFLLGMMSATAFLSFWVSNTATAAIMMPIAIFAIGSSGVGKRISSFAKATVMGVAFAATIGGMATIVGTPPNAIAVENLAEHGIRISFFDWVYHALPYVCLLVPLTWLILVAIYRPEIKRVTLPQKTEAWTKEQQKTVALGLAIVLLWMTSFYHKVPDSAISVLAVVALYAADILDKEDMGRIDWAILLLVGGGLSLGTSIEASGLASSIGMALTTLVSGQSEFVLFLSVIAFAVIVTAFMSNTSTAALIVPIITALAISIGPMVRELTILAGLASSLNFLTPFGTPPSAMAYSSGHISVLDMLKAGIPITIAAMLLLAALAWLYW